MNFLIITHVSHTKKSGKIYGYGPYINEMNLWIGEFDTVTVVGVLDQKKEPSEIDLTYVHDNINFIQIPYFDLTSVKNIIKAVPSVLIIFITLLKQMSKANHIHLRCPGNVALIGCIAQIFFPKIKKTAKYAGNWDWNSNQPWSYRLQQRILRNTFLTKNTKTLVYGEWPDRNKNITPFFTASYWEKEIDQPIKCQFNKQINLCFIGKITENKRPDIPLEVCYSLIQKGYIITLTYCGDGPLNTNIKLRASELGISDKVMLLGNVDKKTVKEVLRNAHFLIFISKSEGWPKAVAEAMFWGCVPITTRVSCVPQMIGENNERGVLVSKADSVEVVNNIELIIKHPKNFEKISTNAAKWSQYYTLEKLQCKIKEMI